jgi:hypothetical protein
LSLLMAYPHTFEILREPSDRTPIFMCGAGTSFGLNPLPAEIFAINRERAEAEVAALTGRPFPKLLVADTAPDALYVWAGQALDELEHAKHRCPKLQIAKSLGLTSDPRWLAGVSLSIAQAKPRHRVLARFVREKRFYSIWTFNWDCRIEAALESIGLSEAEVVADQPWPMRYQRVLSIKDYGKAPPERTIQVHKRHGCIKNVKELEALDAAGEATSKQYADFRLRITKAELDEILDKTTEDYKSFRGQIDTLFAGRPVAVCGWSASERYLLDAMDECKERLRQYPSPVGRLSIVDMKFNDQGHSRLSQIYSVTQAQCHFPVAPAAGVPDQDHFFLWMQALYALDFMRKVLDGHTSLQQWIVSLIERMKADANPSWVTSFVDCFLPAWVQLCWRAGLVMASHAGQLLKPEELRLQGDEWYVPLNQDLPERPELVAAAYLLKALSDKSSNRQFDLIVGGLYKDTTAELFVPLPAWKDPRNLNTINSIGRLAGRIRAAGAFGGTVVLVATSIDGSPVADAQMSLLRDAYMSVARSPAQVRVVNLDEV